MEVQLPQHVAVSVRCDKLMQMKLLAMPGTDDRLQCCYYLCLFICVLFMP